MTYFLVLFGYVLIGLLVNWRLPYTFFQQDEWVIFGNYLYWDKVGLNWFERLFIFQQFTHLIPLSNLFSYIEFKLFGLYFPSYAFFSIGIHIANSFLVYLLADKLLGKKWLGIVSGLIFLINSIPHQAITWVATTMGTALATTFVLLSLIFFADFLKKGRKINLLVLSILFFASLLFKETSLAIIIFFPILWLIYERKKSFKKFLFVLSPFVAMIVLYVIIRIFFLTLSPIPPQNSGLTQPDISVYTYRLVTAPLKSLVQSFIPVNYIIDISDTIIKLGYPNFVKGGVADPYISQTIGSDIVTYLFAALLFTICIIVFKFFKGKKETLLSMIIPASIIFIILTSLPLIIIPGTAGYYSLLDGRHLYITSIFSSILLITIFYGLFFFISKKKIGVVAGLVFSFIFLWMNIQGIRSDLNVQRAAAYTRKSILDRITLLYPKLSQKTVFYIESDVPYYGLAYGDNILPFQSGFGQTLLVWYNARGEDFPACFFRDQFLYVLQSEGYRECEDRGFGYFRKMDNLVKAVRENDIETSDIVAFSYISSKNYLQDITRQVKATLR